ncbi:MAG: MerR family transcriptional regulator [Ruminococcaceae bacterium]|nr:MerR family transcriptional regulator [Oscillospiraceae bacterium]
MTIQEMERKSGLDRTNIRFYEREGLLNPQRRENGYRDYSEDDLQLLLKIKLLRRLGFSLDAIRSLKDGDTALDDALARRLASIGDERRELDATERVCSEMRQDGASFPTLDAQRYLNTYDQTLRLPSGVRANVPESDRVEPVRCPWRRYFARAMDLSLVTLVIYLILALVFHVNVANLNGLPEWLLGLLGWLILIPLEALCLSRWGTTPGKWLLGIRLEHINGRLLTFEEAVWRSFSVFAKGEGLTIPFYNLYRLWKSYKAVSDGEGAEWDEDVTIVVSDLRWWHPARYIAVEAAHFAVTFIFVALIPMMPLNRGDLTVEEFVENYNRQARYMGADDLILQTDGTFVSKYDTGYGTVVIDLDNNKNLEFTFSEENGILTEIAYTREMFNIYGRNTDGEGMEAIQLAIMSFAWADAPLWAPASSQNWANELSAFRIGTLEQDIYHCHMVYTAELTGERLDSTGTFLGKEYTFTFRLYRLPENT